MRIAILDDYQRLAPRMADWDRAAGISAVVPFVSHISDEDELASRLADFDIIVAMRERTPFPATLLRRLPRLRLLVTTGMRNAAIDIGAAIENGVTVCGTRGRGSSTSELTWGLIIALLRNIPREDANLRRGGWQLQLGEGLAGKTLGLLGLGNLGTRVASVGSAFDMDVIAWSQNLTPERATAAGARLVGKQELFRRADIVSIHLRLSDRTLGLVGAAEFAMMKPTAYLINTSRARIVDQDALLDVLENRRITGVALDVYDEEPLPPGHPLTRLPNTVLTPHLGYVERETYEIFYSDALEDIEAFVAGSPIRVIEPD